VELTELTHLADRYGLPLVFLLFMATLGVWGLRAVWNFSKPLANRLVDGVLDLVQKQSDFVDVVSAHQEELKTLVETGHSGHQKTHEKLAEVHNDVKAVRKHIEKGE
jgi:hypothetical protein